MQELAVLASRALTTQRQFTAVADNVANVNTHGFRRLDMNFKEVISRQATPHPVGPASYVADRALLLDQRTGSFEKTSNPLDVAIAGEGFFGINVNGTTHYTRRGQFVINSEGVLSTPEGYPVLDLAGAEIQIPEGSKGVVVANDGTLSTEAGQLGRIGVTTFSPEDMKLLQRTGTAAFVPAEGATPQPVAAPTMRQGYLEASNVNAIQEMVTMEQVSRAYQGALRALSNIEDLEQRAIRNLGQQ